MYDSGLYKRIHSEVDKVRIVDTHEHLACPHELESTGTMDFGRLFLHYASCDLVSAGMPPADMEEIRKQDGDPGWTVEQKWKALKPYYERSWNTAYCECIRIAMRDLYGIDDLREDTIAPLSDKINDTPRASWTREVFDRAGIEIAMNSKPENSGVMYRSTPYPDLFLHDMFDWFTELRVDELSKDAGIDVRNLRDYLDVIDWYFERFADEASALKIGRAYDRAIFFDDVPFSDADRLFSRLVRPDDSPAKCENRALEDFVLHYCMGKAGEYNLPVKFHTGHQEGNSNDVRNSRSALLINLLMKYPETRFDIFHISWPYTEELVSICKSFPNVYVDFCWAWILNPPAARRYLSDMLDTIPLNKIHGFGGDCGFVEGSYGHSVIARREIARVLSDKVEEGRFTEEYAVKAARRLLRENALENFRVQKKREALAERATHPN